MVLTLLYYCVSPKLYIILGVTTLYGTDALIYKGTVVPPEDSISLRWHNFVWY